MVAVPSVVAFDGFPLGSIENSARMTDLWEGLELKNSNQQFSQAKKF